MDVNGSPEYGLTWRHWNMPSGPPICALRASGRRTSGKGCSGWPTPTEQNATGGPMGARHPAGWNTLQTIARLAGWPTPITNDLEKRGAVEPKGLAGISRLAGWSTPNVNERGCESADSKAKRPEAGGIDLQSTAKLAGWASPQQTDFKGADPARQENRTGRRHAGDDLPTQADLAGWPKGAALCGLISTSLGATPRWVEIPSPAVFNPAHSLWLQGCPEAWQRCVPGWSAWTFWQWLMRRYGERSTTGSPACACSATRSSPSSPRSS